MIIVNIFDVYRHTLNESLSSHTEPERIVEF